jgi:DNA-binding winged helix-turn-helix (wHTH) protein
VQLLDTVWNLEPAQTTNIVDVYINYLRRKLQDPPPGELIRTVRGKGYVIPMDADMISAASPVLSELPVMGSTSALPAQTH